MPAQSSSILLVLRRSRRAFSLCSRTRALRSARRAAASLGRPAICSAGSAAPERFTGKSGSALGAHFGRPQGLAAGLHRGWEERGEFHDLIKLGGATSVRRAGGHRSADMQGRPMSPAQVYDPGSEQACAPTRSSATSARRASCGEHRAGRCRRGRGAPGLAGAQGSDRRRRDCARSRERAGERALPRGIRRSRARVEEGRRRGGTARGRRRCAGSA